MADKRRLSAIVLAGGENTRMGSEKAFLHYGGTTFISAIVSEMLRVSDDVVVMIGLKDPRAYGSLPETGVRVFKDDPYLANPLGGIISGLNHVTREYAAVVACDAPLVKAEVFDYLVDNMGTHSAIVPTWKEGELSSTEPLCAMYRVDEAKRAAIGALNEKKVSARQMVLRIKDVEYVDVSRLFLVDPTLGSFADVDTPEQYKALQERQPSKPSAKAGIASGRWKTHG